jgi:hypothetical protein
MLFSNSGAGCRNKVTYSITSSARAKSDAAAVGGEVDPLQTNAGKDHASIRSNQGTSSAPLATGYLLRRCQELIIRWELFETSEAFSFPFDVDPAHYAVSVD